MGRNGPSTWTQVNDSTTRQALKEIVAALPSGVVVAAPQLSALRYYCTSCSVGAGGGTVIMNIKDYDVLGEYNATTGIWTVANTGLYIVSAASSTGSTINSGSVVSLNLSHSGSAGRVLWSQLQPNNDTPQMHGSDNISLTAGDTLSIRIVVPIAMSVAGGTAGTWFSATQLR